MASLSSARGRGGGSGSGRAHAAEIYALAAGVLAEAKEEAELRAAPFVSELEPMLSEERNDRVRRLFGQPHPELSTSYRPDLLHLPLFPTMMGYSSRVLAESWESTNLYWAALADAAHLAPAELNLRVPEWTQQTLERIFATHLEDWPALLHSMRVVGRAVLGPGFRLRWEPGCKRRGIARGRLEEAWSRNR